MYDRIQTVRESVDYGCSFYACTVCMAGYPSENAWVSEVKCNRNIENKRNKNKKNLKVGTVLESEVQPTAYN